MSAKRRAYLRRYMRAYMRKYRKSATGKARMRRHNASGQTKAAKRAYAATPRGRYTMQKLQAAHRGIPFLFTFDDWWALWQPYWEQRGRRADQLCMARHGDTGPYALGNVSIITNRENRQLAAKGRNAA
jgi:hypothetical protein